MCGGTKLSLLLSSIITPYPLTTILLLVLVFIKLETFFFDLLVLFSGSRLENLFFSPEIGFFLECRQCMITSKGEVLVLPFLFTPSLSLSFIFFNGNCKCS